MSHALMKAINLLLSFHLLFHTVSSSQSNTVLCLQDWTQSNTDCSKHYLHIINPLMRTLTPDEETNCLLFKEYLKNLPDQSYTWYKWWEDQKETIDIKHCEAIIPIEVPLTGDYECLCQMDAVCDGLCDDRIQLEFVHIVGVMVNEDPYSIPYDLNVTHENCQTVMTVISQTYNKLCGETAIYKVIQQCAIGTEQPTAPTSPKPTPAPTTSTTASPTTTTPSITSPATTTVINTTPLPDSPVTTGEGTSDNYTTTTAFPTISETTTSYQPTPRPNEVNGTTTENVNLVNDTTYDDYNYDYEPSTTVLAHLDEIVPPANSHPFANLLLVSLIILGFCVFVAWYAKKNQISSDGMNGNNNDDQGFLWGLNKSSSPNDSNVISEDGDKYAHSKFSKKGKFKHKKLSQFDDELMDQQMNIQMAINTKNNNDLLAITPDHVGRLQTRTQPNNISPNIPRNNRMKKPKDKRRTRRGDKGGAFSKLKSHDDPCPDDQSDSDSSSESSGVDMMKMRDEYYASQTFSKKLADTLGDISETVKDAANVVKSKIIKREQPVVRPMQIKPAKNNDKGDSERDRLKKRKPFTMVEDNETTDGFDLSGDDVNDKGNGDESSSSTQENEYREDSETEVRVNIHGRKIKQPMKLPTFNDDGDEVVMLSQSHSSSKHKKHKKKKDKKKKKKKDKDKKHKIVHNEQIIEDKVAVRNGNNSNKESMGNGNNIIEKTKAKAKVKTKTKTKEKVEVKNDTHDINIQMNNDDNMGFGSDELDDNIELTHEDVTMTMNDLQEELMKYNQKQEEEKDKDNGNEDIGENDKNKMDLSFFDNIGSNDANDNNTVDELVALANGNGVKGVVGNGANVADEQND